MMKILRVKSACKEKIKKICALFISKYIKKTRDYAGLFEEY